MIGDSQRHNHGYGTSAIEQIVQKGFNELDLHKIWFMCYEDNLRTQHVAEKVGFGHKIVDPDEYVDKEGKFHNVVRMCILDQEYKARKETP